MALATPKQKAVAKGISLWPGPSRNNNYKLSQNGIRFSPLLVFACAAPYQLKAPNHYDVAKSIYL